jgi:hypothetical protein
MMVWLVTILMAMLLSSCVTTVPAPSEPINTSEALNTAMSVCGIHERMTMGLKQDYGEEQAWIALLDNGLAIEMFVNSEKNTFTMLVTNGQGLACLWASGGSYHAFSGWE